MSRGLSLCFMVTGIESPYFGSRMATLDATDTAGRCDTRWTGMDGKFVLDLSGDWTVGLDRRSDLVRLEVEVTRVW
jgi:hypothetical protein